MTAHIINLQEIQADLEKQWNWSRESNVPVDHHSSCTVATLKGLATTLYILTVFFFNSVTIVCIFSPSLHTTVLF